MHGGNKVMAFEGPARRKQTRKDVFWVGQIITPAGIHECRVLNLSPGGAKIKLSTFVWASQTVTLTLDSLGVFTGVVAWRRDGCVGIAIKEQRVPDTRLTRRTSTWSATAAISAGPNAGLRGIRVGGPAWEAEFRGSKHAQ